MLECAYFLCFPSKVITGNDKRKKFILKSKPEIITLP